jgi:hypothetical protein
VVTDQQVRLLMKLSKREKTLSIAAAKAGMDEKTARKYRRLRRLLSEVPLEHTWRNRKDPFAVGVRWRRRSTKGSISLIRSVLHACWSKGRYAVIRSRGHGHCYTNHSKPHRSPCLRCYPAKE